METMTMLLVTGTEYSFLAHVDVRSFARAETAGSSIPSLQSSIAASLGAIGTSPRCVVEVTRNWGVSDVVGIAATCTPNRDLETSTLDALIVQACNITAPTLSSHDMFLPHQPGLEALLPGDAHGEVIDESSIRRGTSTQTPTASSSVIGRTTSAVSTTASTDPKRDGSTRIGLAFDELAESGVPTWAIVVGGVVAVGIAAVVAGYLLRGVAAVAAEVT